MHGAQRPLLTLAERGVEHELGHAQDRVHGRADLVAHVGEELVLRPVRGHGHLLGQQELLLRTLSVADVDRAADEPHWAALRVPLRLAAHEQPVIRAVPVPEPHLDLQCVGLSGQAGETCGLERQRSSG